MMDFINAYVFGAIAAVLFEGIVLVAFKWRCPLTVVAQKYTKDRRDNFDIFLPEFLARHNKIIFTAMFLVGTALVAWREITRG